MHNVHTLPHTDATEDTPCGPKAPRLSHATPPLLLEDLHTPRRAYCVLGMKTLTSNGHFLFCGTLNQQSEQKQGLTATSAFTPSFRREWILINFGQMELLLSTLKIPHIRLLDIVISLILKTVRGRDGEGFELLCFC